MPLETATYVADLNTANPAATDRLNQADDHLRLIKSALKSTFPNFTSDALSATQASLDAAAVAATDGATLLADTGAHFKTNTLDGLENPSAGTVSVVASNGAGTPAKQTVVEFKGSDKSANFKGPVSTAGAVSAGGPISGPGSWPIGIAGMCFSDTLPTGHGVFAWANGAKVSATTYATLATLWPDRLVDDGANIQLPNLCEVVPVGKSTMGGASARGLLSHITNSLLNTVGSLFGAGKKTLTQANLPNVSFDVNIPEGQGSHRHPVSTPVIHEGLGVGSGATDISHAPQASNTGFATLPAMTGTAASGGSGTAFDIVQPSTAVNWIIRIA